VKQYPNYRDSGVEWLGPIPSHWRVSKLKWLANVNLSNVDKKSKEDEPSVELCNYTDVYYNEQITSEIEFMEATASVEQINSLSLEAGDVIITKDSETADDIAVPAYVSNTLPGVICGYHLALIRPNAERVLGSYLFRSFTANGLQDQFEIAANGVTRYGIGKRTIENSLFVVPSLEEQSSIVAFLNAKTSKIDDIIAMKQRLIKLLEEERVAVISTAVTQGLDPDVPKRPSGIPWLGDIPAHWEVRKLKWLAEVKLSNVDKKSKEDELAVKLCNYTDVYYNEQITTDIEFMEATARLDQIESLALKKGDVIITKDSETADDIAVPAYVPETLPGVVCGYHLAHIRPSEGLINGNYLFRSFTAHGIRDQFEVSANGVTRFGIGKQTIENSLFLAPPTEEQEVIAQYLEKKGMEIDSAVIRAKKEISLLQEYRTALISQAVTGRIDVREEVAV
jgi:type I restriction enzyme S subunit